MRFRRRAVAFASGVLVLAAGAAPQTAVAQSATTPTVQRLGAAVSSVRAGDTIRVDTRVAVRRGNIRRPQRLTYTLRPVAPTTGRVVRLAGVTVRATKRASRRRVVRRLQVPATLAGGVYRLRACVRRADGRYVAHCRSKRIRVVARATPAPAPAPAPRPPARPVGEGLRSLRAPTTGERFYFVMADRFEDGNDANDTGGITPSDPNREDHLEHGYKPDHRGFYHGGDLEGMLERIDYIQDLGTTSIWLTPSFKNKPVQLADNPPTAGYHGYWITDFTQIDPHLGSNEDLRKLVDEAHRRGMKVYFDIITNHTADVIGYQRGEQYDQRLGYVSKDRVPYKTAEGTPFDDREFAGKSTFPQLNADSFPYKPVVPAAEANIKFPEWLNNPIYYHNRGDTTFVGENSYYGDFFGLDDLFTEHPRVQQGMIDIYKQWITDFGIDGFRIDTMKHVNDEFWQAFAPAVLAHAKSVGKSEFFMFGEVFDTTKQFTSHFTTQTDVQAVLDFPFQEAARNFASRSAPASQLGDFFVGDDWYTDADSNAYQLPTFLGNHDMGRIGFFIRQDNPGITDAEALARDRLAHELMYFSRGNPVIYYGDEQGFVGDGGDQLARQDMFPSQVAEYNDDDLIGTDATTAQSNFDRGHPLYQKIQELSDLTDRHPALRNGVQQHRLSSDGPGVYAFSRLDRSTGREYVVAVNNAETVQRVQVPTWTPNSNWMRVYGTGQRLTSTAGDRVLTVDVPPLSAMVYRAMQDVPRSAGAPGIELRQPGEAADRREVVADVGGDGPYDVTFYARTGGGAWESLGTDDNAPYRVFDDVADLQAGTQVEYRAVVLDNAGNERSSSARSAAVAPPTIKMEAPNQNGRTRGEVEVRASATPDDPTDTVQFFRSVNGGDFEPVGNPDTSSPVYTTFDDTASLADGDEVTYKAVLTYAPGQTVESDTRTVTIVQTPVTTVRVHYNRPDGIYAGWGLHLFDPAYGGPAVDWLDPVDPTGFDTYGVYWDVPIADDTKNLGIIIHQPGGDTVPTTREPGGNQNIIPLEHPEVWFKAGDPTQYYSNPLPPG